jgi:signal transduction histidine kinase
MNSVVLIVCAVMLLGCAVATLAFARRWSLEREAILEANEELTRRSILLEDASSQPIVMIDGRGLIRRVNPAAQVLFGYAEGELAGRNILQLIPESPAEKGGWAEVRCKSQSMLRLRFRTARPPMDGVPDTYLFFETGNSNTQSRPPQPDTETAPENTAEIRPSLAAVEDVVGRIVRQFESLLTSISGHAELAMSNVAEDSPARVDLSQLAEASDTASNLARNLLAFTGRQTIPVVPVDLNAILRAMEPQIRHAMHGVRVELADERPTVLANVDCIQQIVLLLCRVAANRSNGSGFRISVSRRKFETNHGVYTGRVPAGEFCTLTISDSGPELAPSTLAHLFEPLYLDAESVGVELAPVYGIIRTLGGWIDVVSQDTGTSFEIILPYGGDAQVSSRQGWKIAGTARG